MRKEAGLSDESLNQLAAVTAIRRLKARYFRAVDLKQWDELRGLLTDDVSFFRAPNRVGPIPLEPWTQGRDSFMAFVQQSLEGASSIHRGFEPEVDVIDATHANGIWPMNDRVTHPTDATRRFTGNGHYHERYERGADGEWRIAQMTLTRIDVRSVPLEDEARG
jgi:hypothetical protein